MTNESKQWKLRHLLAMCHRLQFFNYFNFQILVKVVTSKVCSIELRSSLRRRKRNIYAVQMKVIG